MPGAIASPLSPAQRPTSARDLADAVLLTALEHGADAIRVTPTPHGAAEPAHRVAIELRHALLADHVVDGGLGSALIARFALMTELDLVRGEVQTGRTSVCDGERSADLIVTIRPTEAGLSADLRLVDERATRSTNDADVPPSELPPGTAIGPYRLGPQLGEGGIGVVYQAEHALLRRKAAIKVLKGAPLQTDPEALHGFVREAQAAARIRHPGIVDIYDVGALPDGRPFLIMEFVDGRSLADIVDDNGPLPPASAVRTALGVAEALGAAHDAGIVHRDLTASNVFVTDDGGVKVVDFGAARRLDGVGDVPDGPAGIVFGTPCYMSPEHARGRPCDARSDIYALGVLLYELLTGDVPFDGEDAGTILRQHVHAPAPAVHSLHEPLPERLERLVARMLQKQPEQRPQTAAEVAGELARIERILGRQGWSRWLPV